jgi:hypothetical protein
VIANAAFLAALTVFGVASWLASELAFLAPHKTVIFRQYGIALGATALLVFLNMTALYYTIGRWLFLRDTGRKLAHIDRQLPTSDSALDELRSLLNRQS